MFTNLCVATYFSIRHLVSAISGYSFSPISTSIFEISSAIAVLISPMESITEPGCLTFRYFLRQSLKLSISNSSTTLLLAAFEVDGGFDFHQAFIDLPQGSYLLIWEWQLDPLEHAEMVTNYPGAIDDINIRLDTCAQFRKLVKGLLTFVTNFIKGEFRP